MARGGTSLRRKASARRRFAAAVAGLLALGPAAPSATAQSLEYPVKAAFLYKFGPFVEWPASALEGNAGPFFICVVGDDPFGPAIDQAVAGQHVGRHPVSVRRLARLERGVPGCQVVYAAGSRAQAPAQILAAAQGEPILTVTDESHGDGAKGMIHFVLQNSRVRFEIDPRAAQQSGLSISSKLLSLAINARSAAEGAP